jgi:hypothetical protein
MGMGCMALAAKVIENAVREGLETSNRPGRF